MSNIFEQATRQALRFPTSKGVLNTEDLWDLPLTSRSKGIANLDDLAVEYYKKLEKDSGLSFVDNTTQTSVEDQLKFDIIKHIIDVKVVERNKAKIRAANALEKQRIMQFIADRQDVELKAKSVEELTAMLQAIESAEKD